MAAVKNTSDVENARQEPDQPNTQPVLLGRISQPRVKPVRGSRRNRNEAQHVREAVRRLCLSLFFNEDTPIRSLGFTSAIRGEGKTFLALVTAEVLAHDLGVPTTLLDCNWDHRCIHDQFKLPAGPGLAEWLRRECGTEDIRHPVGENLTVITAGDSQHDALRLLRQLRLDSTAGLTTRPDELLIADLPCVVASSYGAVAAGFTDSLVVVVRSRATPTPLISDAMQYLSELPVQGMILNEVETHIPRWLQPLL